MSKLQRGIIFCEQKQGKQMCQRQAAIVKLFHFMYRNVFKEHDSKHTKIGTMVKINLR